tara:strand:- start:208 stop:393 length:186 start_codon:yes stop_codon:yes gene_type:complete
MENRYITKWGEFCQMVYKNQTLSETEKSEFVQSARKVLIELLDQNFKDNTNKLNKLYDTKK